MVHRPGQPGPWRSRAGQEHRSHAGVTIRIGPGTYTGGITIDVSVTLVGAGASSTIIRGGGPVLTIGAFDAASEPAVSIHGVTITGVTRSSPESIPFTGHRGVFALGGGVEIPPNADFSGGATVTITDSVIAGNRVAPTRALPAGPPCPGVPCPFGGAAGGGIDNWGRLTLANTTVSHNRVGSVSSLSTLASDAEGGAIMNWLDTLTVTNSVISDNQASATAPNGRFADSAGIMVEGGTLTMNGSEVRHNRAVLHASLPKSVDLLAIAGGIHITENAAGTIRHTTISENSASATNTVGDATAFSGGLHTDARIRIRQRRRPVLRRGSQPAVHNGQRQQRTCQWPHRNGSRWRNLRGRRAERSTSQPLEAPGQQHHRERRHRKFRYHSARRGHLRHRPRHLDQDHHQAQPPRPLLRLLNRDPDGLATRRLAP